MTMELQLNTKSLIQEKKHELLNFVISQTHEKILILITFRKKFTNLNQQ